MAFKSNSQLVLICLSDSYGSLLLQVILHDAVRPFVDEPTLQSVAEAAKKHGVSSSL